ncbi:hypothetical protein AGDE_14712 [Angomonas deanei]|uniref:Nuclear pore protein n=1 Tax=Angomonas deanei TaxID=59799 RepID=A0A7G2C6X6_9TRYP|nr:hypothetical protein AGDE_14712 [Angomonas deanei]CAD2215349.1 Nup93/Nic96, putative [Angomonas deanei]|eukprot:EPY20373.1 hypothetical protein AGDE_14712 [Angomonas deanei]
MNSLWRVVSNILQPILGEGNAADEMSYVSSSRASLEKLALRRLLSAVGHATSDGDVGHLSMENVLSLIKCSYGSSGPWRAIFQCMLVGRYDAAAECAKEVGSNSLILALSDLANSTPLQRSKAPPKMDVLDLYRDSQTENDLFRKAVLFLLLSGHIDDTTKDPLRVMTTLCSEMGQCVEDNLWMRLCCVRGVEVQGRVKSIHSLSTLQKIVKNDAHSLLGSFKENEYLFLLLFFSTPASLVPPYYTY